MAWRRRVLHTSSFPDVYEDIVTMGANAAKKLMDRKGLTPADIGRIDVATESAFDNSKPVSTYSPSLHGRTGPHD